MLESCHPNTPLNPGTGERSPCPAPECFRASPLPAHLSPSPPASANPSPTMTGSSKLPGIVNYFIGNDPSRWHAKISTYHGVTARGVYPGVDLAWHGSGANLEYDFTVAPGADPNQVAFNFQGA